MKRTALCVGLLLTSACIDVPTDDEVCTSRFGAVVLVPEATGWFSQGGAGTVSCFC
jgi:hypothetical protein